MHSVTTISAFVRSPWVERSGAHSKKTLFIGRSFIKSIDRSVEKSNNSIIDHLVCQAKLLLQYYQDFYSIWKSRSRWTTQWSAIGEELLFVLKCCPTPPTSSRKMAKLLCSHIEPYILEQVMIYFTFCWRQNVTKCGSLLKLRSHGNLFVMELVQKFAPSTTSYGYGGFQKLLLCVIWIGHTIPKDFLLSQILHSESHFLTIINQKLWSPSFVCFWVTFFVLGFFCHLEFY